MTTDVELFFSGWAPLLRILIVGTALFLAVVLLLRVTGNRTLSRLNTFDFIVVVAVGAVFGRALTARDLSLSEALLAIVLLIVLQYLMSWLKMHSKTFGKLVNSEPVVLYMNGELRHAALRRERITDEDLNGAIQVHGFERLEEVQAVILEPTGRMAVIGKKNT